MEKNNFKHSRGFLESHKKRVRKSDLTETGAILMFFTAFLLVCFLIAGWKIQRDQRPDFTNCKGDVELYGNN